MDAMVINRNLLSILVVDQDKDMLDLLEDEITDMGHRVTRVSEELNAIVKASEERFDIVIAQMEISGPIASRLLTYLKRLQPEASIVAMTGLGPESAIREALKSGADYHVAKPIAMESLKDFISHLGRERFKHTG